MKWSIRTARRCSVYSLVLAGLLYPLLGQVSPLAAQPTVPYSNTVCPPKLPQVPVDPPRPDKGPTSVGAFVNSLTSTDTIFEVLVGQGRIMTFKEDLAMVKKMGDKFVKEEAVVAIG